MKTIVSPDSFENAHDAGWWIENTFRPAELKDIAERAWSECVASDCMSGLGRFAVLLNVYTRDGELSDEETILVANWLRIRNGKGK